MAGIVYYANYLKFIERARSAFVRNLGIDQNDLRKRHGTIFAVRKVVADYLKPAIFEDQLTVVTSPQFVTSARLILNQDVMRRDMLLFRAEVTLVYLSPSGRPLRLPSAVLAAATVGAVKLAGTI
ncbi:MAG: acyl-CoA thioesterase [Paracoccaceae bacterium]|nr:acyl-CoA thioesterase [Paracoccaceae bacterium]